MMKHYFSLRGPFDVKEVSIYVENGQEQVKVITSIMFLRTCSRRDQLVKWHGLC
jgi:hypothetical protein